jgi:hypothetical protein
MKIQVEFIIFLLFSFAFMMFLFPSVFVDAAKVQSGVTINAPSTTETEKICDDMMDNDNDGKIDADDEDCPAPAMEVVGGTCGLEILSGVPINYGQLNFGQDSAEQKVTYKNVGNTSGSIMVKGESWVASQLGDPTGTLIIVLGPEATHVSNEEHRVWENKFALQSSEFPLGQLPAGATGQSYWQLRLPPSPPHNVEFRLLESPHQEITIDLLC